jgi:S-adenosylmethionine:tRNA ribosyltransferase-isomerase
MLQVQTPNLAPTPPPRAGVFAPDFTLPASLEADRPPEARGLARDGVRLMVSWRHDDRIKHSTFCRLTDYLEPGDLLVINTSGTLNAALPAMRSDGTVLELHLSTHLPADIWAVELRRPVGDSTEPYRDGKPCERLTLPGGGAVTLHVPYLHDRASALRASGVRLWIATLDLPLPVLEYLEAHGFPIRYNYVRKSWPISYYQTVYATEPGSAEMPSAGRAFTRALLTDLAAHGIQIAPLLLHTGVASLEDHEPPYEEYYHVPVETAAAVNAAHAARRRVIGVGTTVIRALETVTDSAGITHPGDGWTILVVSPQTGIRSVDGLLTGLHEPRSTHLMMLEALAGREHLAKTYAGALRERYLWHEFGDLHLILP